jgi:hypothetical protein
VSAPIAEGHVLHRETAIAQTKNWLKKRWALDDKHYSRKEDNPIVIAAGTPGIGAVQLL